MLACSESQKALSAWPPVFVQYQKYKLQVVPGPVVHLPVLSKAARLGCVFSRGPSAGEDALFLAQIGTEGSWENAPEMSFVGWVSNHAATGTSTSPGC